MPEEELYDLQTDPYEIHNLAASDKPEHQAELKRLRGGARKMDRGHGRQGAHTGTLHPARAQTESEQEAEAIVMRMKTAGYQTFCTGNWHFGWSICTRNL